MRAWALLSLWFVVASGVAACGGQGPSPQALNNLKPRARLSAPLYAPVGQPVTLDAGSSFDPDGAVVDYTFSFSDGARQLTLPTAETSHTFQQPGAYEVAVVVRDDAGGLARASQLVVVRTDPPACEQPSDCQLGAECRDKLCYQNGSGPGAGVAECAADADCGTGLTCRAGLCLSASEPPAAP